MVNPLAVVSNGYLYPYQLGSLAVSVDGYLIDGNAPIPPSSGGGSAPAKRSEQVYYDDPLIRIRMEDEEIVQLIKNILTVQIRHCFITNSVELSSKFDKLVESGMPEEQAAATVISDKHKELHDRMNALKKSMGLQEDEYVGTPVDKAAVAEIQQKADEKKKEAEAKIEEEKKRKLDEMEQKHKEKEDKKAAEKQQKQEEKKQKKEDEEKAKRAEKRKSEPSAIVKENMDKFGVSEEAAKEIAKVMESTPNMLIAIAKAKTIIARDQADAKLNKLNEGHEPVGTSTDVPETVEQKEEKYSSGFTDEQKDEIRDKINTIIDGLPESVSSMERMMAKQFPFTFLREIAEQAQRVDNIAGEEKTARDGAVSLYGEEAVQYAEKLFPPESIAAASITSITEGETSKLNEILEDTPSADVIQATNDFSGQERTELALAANRRAIPASREILWINPDDKESLEKAQRSKKRIEWVGDRPMSKLMREVESENNPDVTDFTRLHDLVSDPAASRQQRGIAAAIIAANRIVNENDDDLARLARDLGVKVQIVYDDSPKGPGPMVAHSGSKESAPFIVINAYQLGKRLEEFTGEKKFYDWMEMAAWEEGIHQVAFKEATREEILQVAKEMSPRERALVEYLYNGGVPMSDYAAGAEYVRAIVQGMMFGTTTELLKPETKKSAVRTLLSKIFQYLKNLFDKSTNRMSKQIVRNMANYLGVKMAAEPRSTKDTFKKEATYDTPKFGGLVRIGKGVSVMELFHRNNMFLVKRIVYDNGRESFYQVRKVGDSYVEIDNGQEVPGFLGGSIGQVLEAAQTNQLKIVRPEKIIAEEPAKSKYEKIRETVDRIPNSRIKNGNLSVEEHQLVNPAPSMSVQGGREQLDVDAVLAGQKPLFVSDAPYGKQEVNVRMLPPGITMEVVDWKDGRKSLAIGKPKNIAFFRQVQKSNMGNTEYHIANGIALGYSKEAIYAHVIKMDRGLSDKSFAHEYYKNLTKLNGTQEAGTSFDPIDDLLGQMWSEMRQDKGDNDTHDPIREYQIVMKDEKTIGETMYTHMKRDPNLKVDPSDYIRDKVDLIASENLMRQVVDDVMNRYGFDDALDYFVLSLKDPTINTATKNQLAKVLIIKLQNTRPDVANAIRTKIDASLGAASGLNMAARVNQGLVPDQKKRGRKPKIPIDTQEQQQRARIDSLSRAFGSQAAEALSMIHDDNIEKTVLAIQSAIDESRISSKVEDQVAEIKANAEQRAKDSEKAAKEATDALKNVQSKVRKFTKEEKEMAESRKKASEYQRMTRSNVKSIQEANNELKKALQKLIESCSG